MEKRALPLWRELLQIPNLLTISRIISSPLVLLAFDSLVFLLILGLFAAITDFLDGYLARFLHQEQGVGVALDPVADKLFVMFFLIGALWRGLLAPWMILALLLRDMYVALAIPIFLRWFDAKIDDLRTRFKARMAGKIVTSLQFLCVVFFVLTPRAFWFEKTVTLHWLHLPFLLLFPASLWAIVDYTRYQLRMMRGENA